MFPLALAALTATPGASPYLPVEMEKVVSPYLACVDREYANKLGERVKADDEIDGPAVMDLAIAACSTARIAAINSSERALRGVPGHEDRQTRSKFVRQRLDKLDNLFRWGVSPEADPDNWNPDAQS